VSSSARALAGLGFAALATSSGVAAGVLGRKDGELSRDEALAHARAIVDATDLPVAADLENGFGGDPDTVALTIRLAAEAGLVGGSIEDACNDRRLYPLSQAVERVAAAVEAARALPFAFTLTARAENFLRGHADLDDTLVPLQAFEKASADVLFAPALPDHAEFDAAILAGDIVNPGSELASWMQASPVLKRTRAPRHAAPVSRAARLARNRLGRTLRWQQRRGHAPQPAAQVTGAAQCGK